VIYAEYAIISMYSYLCRSTCTYYCVTEFKDIYGIVRIFDRIVVSHSMEGDSLLFMCTPEILSSDNSDHYHISYDILLNQINIRRIGKVS
jgi:hypothetical protein